MGETTTVKPQRCGIGSDGTVWECGGACCDGCVNAIALPLDLSTWDPATRERVLDAIHKHTCPVLVKPASRQFHREHWCRDALTAALAALAQTTEGTRDG